MLEGFITLAQAAAGEAGNTAAATAQAAAATAQAAAQPAAAQQASGWESIMSLLPMIIIIVAMFYLMYRGQKKEQKRRAEMIDSIKAGTQVLTIGGIMGKIVSVSEKSFELEIARNIRVEIAKSAVASILDEEEKHETGDIVKK